MASALVNAELYERVAENESRLGREMKIAREIQRQLMPDEVPSIPPLQMAVLFKPVAQLGGDLYDWIAFDDGRMAIVIGDVAGKGAPAALYGALSSGVIRTRAGRKYPPGQMLELVNKTLYQRPVEGQFVAVTYAVYDPNTRTIALANSGLPYPLLVGPLSGFMSLVPYVGLPLALAPPLLVTLASLGGLPARWHFKVAGRHRKSQTRAGDGCGRGGWHSAFRAHDE